MQSENLLRTWKVDLSEFGRRNSLRPTRIEVVDPSAGLESDFWIQDGMLLSGIDLEEDRNCRLSIDIMLQTTPDGSLNHLTHRIADVTRLELQQPASNHEVLEIENSAGIVTIVRFES